MGDLIGLLRRHRLPLDFPPGAIRYSNRVRLLGRSSARVSGRPTPISCREIFKRSA